MKVFLFFLISFFSIFSFSQDPKKDFGLPPTDLRQGSLHQGDLFTIKMVPGDKEVSFYVVGKKTGHLKVDKMQMEAVFDSEVGEAKRIVLSRRSKAFILPSALTKDIRLEVKGETPGEVDKLHIKVKP